MMWVLVLGGPVVAYFAFRWYNVSSRAFCKSNTDLSGKTVLITGGNAGIGYETALEVAKRNARVIIACRDKTKGDESAQRISEESGNVRVSCMALDLSSLKSIRGFAGEFHSRESRLDILINNAGIIGSSSKRETEDGLELTIGTNHFGHFLLTNLLLDKLKQSAPSRVVTVSSVVQSWGKIDFNNLNSERSYSAGGVYFNSKLANVLFVKELHRRYSDQGISAFSLHPGSVRTQLLKTLPAPLKAIFDYLIMPLFFISAREGAQTSLHCALEPGLETKSGCYFSNCAVTDEGPRAKDKEVAQKLWDVSETITGLA